MSEDAPAGGAAAPVADHHQSEAPHQEQPLPLQYRSRTSTWQKSDNEVHVSGVQTPMSGLRVEAGLDSYFVGPRDMDAHSKLPYFLRLHGSVTPRMILPLFMIGSWATLITCLNKFVTSLAVNTLLLTVLGFVVGLALSFRSTSAYERYSDGRKSWATLSVQARNMARLIWVHSSDFTPGKSIEEDTSTLLAKVSAMNLILAFAVSLKHKLRFEPYAHYNDLNPLISHLTTFAKAAHEPSHLEVPRKSSWKSAGEYLGLTLASSNPRKIIKRSTAPLGNLPLEILTYLSAYLEEISTDGRLKSPVVYGQVLACVAALTETQSSAERVLTTPLPIGYNILISQIVLLYVYLLPFQLVGALDWITIPGTIAAAYIILGLAAIGNELENPFGNDVNDLPLDAYCDELRCELDALMSKKPETFAKVVSGEANSLMWPLSDHGFNMWNSRSEKDIRGALTAKVVVGKGSVAGSVSEKTAVVCMIPSGEGTR